MKKAIMYGGGNIGRGFIAQLFYMSGYETVFIDVNDALVNRINENGKYPIFITNGDEYTEFTVENIRAVNGRDIDAVAKEIATADLMATAVGANILKFIAEPIAAGIDMRAKDNGAPLNIIVCENLLDADKYLRSLIDEKISENGKAYLTSSVGIAEASIGRMVPAAPKEITDKDPLAICVEPYCVLPVDSSAFIGDVPDIVGIKPFAPFDFYIRRKLYMHNMSHAILAYTGWLRGYSKLWEAAGDYELRYIALGALLESSLALSQEYGVDMTELIDHSYDLLNRFDNKLLGDTVERVGKDTIRKLAPTDRLTGAALLCLKHNIKPVFIAKGIAAALKFAPESDDAAKTVNEFYKENGLDAAVEKFCGTDSKELIEEIRKNI